MTGWSIMTAGRCYSCDKPFPPGILLFDGEVRCDDCITANKDWLPKYKHEYKTSNAEIVAFDKNNMSKVKPKLAPTLLLKEPVKIVAVAHDGKKRITHVQMESGRVYPFGDVAGFIKNKQYLFVAQAPNKIDYAFVSVRSNKGGRFLTTLRNKTKEDNLDYLPPLVP